MWVSDRLTVHRINLSMLLIDAKERISVIVYFNDPIYNIKRSDII